MTEGSNAVACGSNARQPVRVKLQRVTASVAENHPPDGDSAAWWGRLKAALGTTSSDFVSASLFQLQTAAQLPGSGISEMGVNAALAVIEALEPRDEIEGVLAVQMACTHAAAMAVLARFAGGGGSERRVIALGTTAARLLKAFTLQEEALRRRRGGNQQHVRVEHVHVHSGGQAIVGNVKAPV
jgi:hypothetical protein